MSEPYSELPWEEQKLVMLYTVHGRAIGKGKGRGYVKGSTVQTVTKLQKSMP